MPSCHPWRLKSVTDNAFVRSCDGGGDTAGAAVGATGFLPPQPADSDKVRRAQAGVHVARAIRIRVSR
jgi:hypothetical protein